MKVVVIGVGYVGLVSSACFAELGFEVICLDTDIAKIHNLQNGIIPIYEPNLTKICLKQIKNKNLRFTTEYNDIKTTEIIFLTVGTPSNEEDGTVNLKYLKKAIKMMLPFLPNNVIIVIKSTVPPGTSREISEFIKQFRPGLTFHIASNPEFLRQGNAVNDFLKADRIVIGTNSKYAKNKMCEIYSHFIQRKIPMVFTDIETSELIKYVSNGFLATKIAYINEMSNICERMGANIEHLIQGVGLDHRIGMASLRPGPGFGGSCFPKDIKALAKFAEEKGVTSQIIEAVMQSNNNRKKIITNRIERECGGNLRNNKIGILGVTFKANTDDVRESPSIKIMEELVNKNALIKAYDPLGMENAKKVLNNKNIIWCNGFYEAAEDTDALVITTEWEEFKSIDPFKIKEIMKSPTVLDLRNILDEETFKSAGIKYRRIGCPN